MAHIATFGALKHRNFRLFFTGHLISLVGWWMHQVAQPWLVLSLTNSAFYVGLVSALGTLPVTLLSLVGGVVADRFPRRLVIFATQGTAMVVALGLAFVVFADVVALWHVIVAATLFGVVAAFDIPGRQAFLYDLVGRADLTNAIALNSSAFSASRVIGPAIGGMLIAAVGIAWCFLLNGLSFIAVLVGLWLVRIESADAGHSRARHRSVAEGLRFVMSERRARTLILLLSVLSVFGFSGQILIPVYVKDTLTLGATAYGWALAASGIGALIGALTLATFSNRVHKGQVVLWSGVAFGVSVVGLGLVRSFVLAIPFLVLIGLTQIVYTASTNILLQTLAPDELRGRVISIYTLAFMGLVPVGSFLAGSVADRFSPATYFIAGGIVCLIMVASTRWLSPRLARTA